jgi:hypothetical protein
MDGQSDGLKVSPPVENRKSVAFFQYVRAVVRQ